MQVTWRILSKDDATRTMVVEYSGAVQSMLNIPQPMADQDVNEWVSKYAPTPVLTANTYQDIAVGQTGEFEHEVSTPDSGSEQANVVGSWNEEYIRALIYSVLEEVRESTV